MGISSIIMETTDFYLQSLCRLMAKIWEWELKEWMLTDVIE